MGLFDAIASVGSTILGVKSAKDAAKKGEKASERDLAFQRESRDLVRSDTAPHRYASYEALDAAMSMVGLPSIRGYIPDFDEGEAPLRTGEDPYVNQPPRMRWQGRDAKKQPRYRMSAYGGSRDQGGPVWRGGKYYVGRPETVVHNDGTTSKIGRNAPTLYQPTKDGYVVPENPGGQPGRYNFMADPGYGFRKEEGERSRLRLASARGGLKSGGLDREMVRYGQDYASAEYDKVFRRIASIANLSQPGLSQANQATLYTGAGMGSAARSSGLYAAAGEMGQGNAWMRGINDLAQGGAFQGAGEWLKNRWGQSSGGSGGTPYGRTGM